MNCRLSQIQRFVGSFLCFAAMLLCSSVFTNAQTQRDYDPEDAPPPLRYIPNELRDQLSAKTNLKDRTKLILTLADERLRRAEQLTVERRFSDASAELGIYQALVEESVRFLNAAQQGGSSSRDQYRKLEVAFRSYRTRLELLSRSTSSSYRVHLIQISNDTWRIRTQVLNRFFGDEVIDDAPYNDPQNSTRDANNRTTPDNQN